MKKNKNMSDIILIMLATIAVVILMNIGRGDAVESLKLEGSTPYESINTYILSISNANGQAEKSWKRLETAPATIMGATKNDSQRQLEKQEITEYTNKIYKEDYAEFMTRKAYDAMLGNRAEFSMIRELLEKDLDCKPESVEVTQYTENKAGNGMPQSSMLVTAIYPNGWKAKLWLQTLLAEEEGEYKIDIVYGVGMQGEQKILRQEI